ncbi:MAG: glycerol kinase GlpK [Spirochaetales bacterium]|nr:glycerol kinase GlpK [Leptospiraceae bacterium]MCP5480332.1 glycerol kinase GlpK [Spirochaetales bacterium]
MAKDFIIAIDQGTTGSRVFCFGKDGAVISSVYREFTQHFPKPGWVEHDAEEIWQGVRDLLGQALEKGGLKASEAAGIGITNQRETAVVWERSTGKPIHRAIVWQCRRTSDRCEELKKQGHEELVRNRTGLVIDAYFSGTKYEWILNQVSGARARAEKGELCAGTIDSWLLFKLTGEFRSDYTNASRTMLYNIEKKEWDAELTKLLGIAPAALPEVVASSSEFGRTKGVDGLPDGVPVLSMIGDQQAALFGQLRVNPGEAKNTYGTGCFLLFNTGDEFLISRSGLITTLACNARGDVCYALEGAVFIGGAVVQWLRDALKFFPNASESEELARQLDDEPDEIVVVPAFAGLGAPYWDMKARGAIFGISRDTSPARITRAALKSIALQSCDLVRAMEKDTGKKMDLLRADGGAAANRYLLQYQADILDTPVERPANLDTTALGAAYLAGLKAGVWKDVPALLKLQSDRTRVEPKMKAAERDRELRYWHKAVERVRGWVE